MWQLATAVLVMLAFRVRGHCSPLGGRLSRGDELDAGRRVPQTAHGGVATIAQMTYAARLLITTPHSPNQRFARAYVLLPGRG